MTIVVKIGGAAIEDALRLRKCAQAIAELAQDGHRIAVVHGGGGALTRMLERLGKKSEFVDGLRVTDAETRDTALMVLAGVINKKLVAAIQEAGMPAIGFCGGDGMTFRARKKFVHGRDLGFVGEICFAEPCWIEALWRQGGIPVMASLARLTCEMYLLVDREGHEEAAGPQEVYTNGQGFSGRGARERYAQLLALHDAGQRDLVARGLNDAHAWLPPPIAKRFGRRLAALGWMRDDAWTPYCKRFDPE